MKWCYLVLVAAMVSCQQKEPYQKLVDDYLERHLDDPGSYECVELGTPKVITPMIRTLEEVNQRVALGEIPSDSIAPILERTRAQYISQGKDPYDTLAWEVSHTYRARNKAGNLELMKYIYTLDKEQTCITKARRR